MNGPSTVIFITDLRLTSLVHYSTCDLRFENKMEDVFSPLFQMDMEMKNKTKKDASAHLPNHASGFLFDPSNVTSSTPQFVIGPSWLLYKFTICFTPTTTHFHSLSSFLSLL